MSENFTSPDFYNIDELLSEEHKLIRESTRQWVSKSVSPIIEEYAQKAEFPSHLIKELGEIGAFGPYIPEKYGGAGLDQISYGIMMQEIERGDSGIRSTASVQSSLVIYPIWKFGSDEQKEKYLPKLATGEIMGCFGLTEPDHGSNPSGMISNFKSDGDDVILNGAKMWISNSPFADIAIVWAKDKNKWNLQSFKKHIKNKNVYLTFDVDGFDSSIMPATGTPEPGGLFWDETLNILKIAAKNSNIVGGDINELSPIKGFNSYNFLVAKLAYKILSYKFLL